MIKHLKLQKSSTDRNRYGFLQIKELMENKVAPLEVTPSKDVTSNRSCTSQENMEIVTLDQNQTEELTIEAKDDKLEIVPSPTSSQVEEPIDLSDTFTTDTIFSSRQELIDWAKETGLKVNTVIVIKKSDYADSGRTPRLFLGCERAGTFKSHRKRAEGTEPKFKKRKSGTKLCDCPFRIRGVHIANSQDKWKAKVECGRHNHPLVRSSEGHSYGGRLKPEEQRVVEEMSRSGMKPKIALSVIKAKNPANSSTIQHIYNARSNMRITEKEGKQQMQQLIKLLRENGYVEWSRRHEDTDTVKDLFWAHPESVQLAKCFPHVFFMDSTYKTNKFKLSLFEIVGVTSTMKTFSVCFTLMEEEKEDNYLWVLEKFYSLLDHNVLPSVIVIDKASPLINGLQKVFPSSKLLLCRLHISRNVMAKTKKEIPNTDNYKKFIDKWSELVMAETEDEFERLMVDLDDMFSDFPTILSYVKDTWLNQYKENFVVAWTDRYMHFGYTSTNRADGAHKKLKRQLGLCKFDFLGLWNTMHPLLIGQMTEIKTSFEVSLNMLQHEYMEAATKEIRGFISKSAIDLILAEKKRGGDICLDGSECKCVLRHTHGLPCAHELLEYEHEGRAIPLASIHPFWKMLSVMPNVTNRGDLDFCPEFQSFARRYEGSTVDQKVYLLKILKELASPETSCLVAPKE